MHRQQQKAENFVEITASLFRFGFASSGFVKLIELYWVGVFGVSMLMLLAWNFITV